MVSFIALVAMLVGAATSNSPVAGAPVQITPRKAFFHNVFWAHTDPSDNRFLIACSQRRVPRAEKWEDVAYISSDGGLHWHETIVDNSTNTVLEESCGYDADGHAFLATGAWLLIAGQRHFVPTELHVFRSTDHGLTWKRRSRRGLVDLTLVTPDTVSHGTRRLYIFGHYEIDHPLGSAWSSMPVLLSSSNDGRTFHGPVSPYPKGFHYVTAYPSGSAVLKDGTVIAAVSVSTSKGHKGIDLIASRDGGRHVGIRAAVREVSEGWVGWPSLAVDTRHGQSHGHLYLAWTELHRKMATMYIADSNDSGKHWRLYPVLQKQLPWKTSSPTVCLRVGGSGDNMESLGEPGIAVNKDGMLGVAWPENGSTILFASFQDRSHTLIENVTLSRCTPTPVILSDVDIQNYLETPRVRIAADTSGVFHVFWAQPGPLRGELDLWTRSIRAP